MQFTFMFHSALSCSRSHLSLPTLCMTLLLTLFGAELAKAEQDIQKVPLSENQILLLDVQLNGNIISGALEAYPHADRTLVAIEPLFDALSLKYQLYADKLLIWKGEEEYTLAFERNVTGNFFTRSGITGSAYWASDGYFVFIDTDTLARFFGVIMSTNTFQLRLDIQTEEKGYLFPLQRLAILQKQRILAAASTTSDDEETKAPPITIEDQYQFVTAPTGRVSALTSRNQDDSFDNYSLQLGSDLLFHAADLTLSKSTDENLSARLKMSRYKTRPDERILGAFDSYSWGDVSGFSNNLTTSSSGGLGVVAERKPVNFRRRNLAITLQETAPPGWEAELFHNNRFIGLTTVPDNGLLTFEEVPTEYGNNYYQIKLYSPYGDVEIIEQYLDLRSNALSGGAKAYNLHALDANHRLIDDQNDAEYGVTDFGGTFDYGLHDRWQIGLGFNNTEELNEEAQQLYSVKNAFSFPGMLLENDAAVSSEGGYAQLTSLIGNAFGNQRFSLGYESAKDFQSGRINAPDQEYSAFSGSYGGSVGSWGYSFSGNYYDQGDTDYWRVTNSLYRSFRRVHVSHSLSYVSNTNVIPVGIDGLGQLVTEQQTTQSLLGVLGISGALADSVRASGSIAYQPENSSPILNSSSMLLEWNPRPFDINNYLTVRYQPLADSSRNWQFGHRILWEHRKFQFTFGSSYSADESWTLEAGIRFFLGYDYHNQRTIMRNYMTHQAVTIDAHTYLDRQANGVPDPLDYNLSDVEFVGSPEWEGMTSGETGRVLLPGASANGPFYFGARWKSGAETVNNDYVVYAHPGANIKVNMPFYLTSEIMGFVQRAGNDAPLNNVKITLHGKYTQRETTTDADGYFEFLGLQPDLYEIRVDQDFLAQKSFTSDVVGYRLTTPNSGGFVELDIITLQRKEHENDVMAEQIVPFKLTPNNSEAIVREDNVRKRRNYFNLPVKDKLEAPHVLPELPEPAPLEPPTPREAPKLDSGIEHSRTAQRQASLLPTISISHTPADSSAAPVAATPADAVKLTVPPAANTDKKTAVNPNAAYTIQLGAFKLKEQADRMKNSLGHIPDTTEISQSGEFYRVIVGRFVTQAEAESFAKNHLAKHKAYVRRLTESELK